MKNSLLTATKIILAFGLGFLIIWLSLRGLNTAEKQNIINSFRAANYFWVVVSILLGILSHYIRAIRWKMLLKPIGYQINTSSSFLSVMIGYFANLGLPRAGEVARCSVLYKEEKVPFEKSFGTVIVERAIDMIIFILLFFVAFAIEYSSISNYVSTEFLPKLNEKFGAISMELIFIKIPLGIVAFSVILYFLLKSRLKNSNIAKKTKGIFIGIWQGLKSIALIERPIIFVLLSIAIWVLYFLMVYVCFFAIDQLVGLSPFAALSVLVLGTVGIMVTPGGIGLYPVIVAQTLVLYGFDYGSGLGIALGWLAWSAQTIMIIVVGAISLIITTIKKPTHAVQHKS